MAEPSAAELRAVADLQERAGARALPALLRQAADLIDRLTAERDERERASGFWPGKCPMENDEPGPCPCCGATLSGDDPARGICQSSVMPLRMKIHTLTADLAAARLELDEAKRWLIESVSERQRVMDMLNGCDVEVDEARRQRDAHFAEIERARKIIDDLKAFRERGLTQAVSADWINVILSEDARVEDGKLANGPYLAAKIAAAAESTVAQQAADEHVALAALPPEMMEPSPADWRTMDSAPRDCTKIETNAGVFWWDKSRGCFVDDNPGERRTLNRWRPVQRRTTPESPDA